MDDEEIAQATALDLLTPRLKDRDVWADLVQAFDLVMESNVDGPILQLETLRYLPPDADPKVLADACRMLGFNLSQDVLNLSADKFTRLATQLGMYPDTNGTQSFVKFLSLMINGYCNIDYLWSRDYVNFYPEPKGELLENGGAWFKTTHIDLVMGFFTLAGLQLAPGQTLYQKIIDIFYSQDPITLVIERLGFDVEVEAELAFGARMLDPEREYEILVGGNIRPDEFPVV